MMKNLSGLTILFLVLAGCASMSSLEPPDLTLVDVQLTEATLFETTLQVQLRIANPNPDPLEFEGASFKLTLEERKVGRGMTSEAVVVDRLATEVVEVTFHVSNASVILRLQEILAEKSVAYGVSGKLYLSRAIGSRKLKVQSSGRLDMAHSSLAPSR